MHKRPQRIIVVGASAGGISAMTTLFSRLDPMVPSAVLAVQHLSPHSPGILDTVLARESTLPVAFAEDAMPLTAGRLLLAPPDHHLVVQDGLVRVGRGPRENGARPAIDVLFRTAAVAHSSRVVGVVLTGMLDDGTAGLQAIKRCGGVAIVQDPSDAAYSDMPANAARLVQVDYKLPLLGIAEVLNELGWRAAPPPIRVPDDVRLEAEFTVRGMMDIDRMDELGEPSDYSCPECGGRLWRINDPKAPRYRCHVGHAYGLPSLLESQDGQVEQSLWSAMRTLKEQAHMLERLAGSEEGAKRLGSASSFRERAAESRMHAERLLRLRQKWPFSGREGDPGGDSADPEGE
jgi:two-component system chemotaxis response regulator CheB